MPFMTSEFVGENEVASRRKNEVPLVEHGVISKQRHELQELDPMVRMAEVMKNLQQEIRLFKKRKNPRD